MKIMHRLALMATVSVAAQFVLAAPLAVTAGATLPGSNGRIAFTKGCCDSEDIYTVDPDGSGLAKVNRSRMDAGSPSWAPHGSRILAEVARIFPNIRIATMASDGSDVRFLTNGRTGAREPAFSPDGTRVVYHTQDGLYVRPSDGSSRPVRLFSGSVMEPSISPDGASIVFSAFTGPQRDRRENLWVIGAGGADAHRLTTTPNRRESDPYWSPDGKSIVYSAGDQVSEYEWDSDVRVLDVATKRSQLLFGSTDVNEYAGPVSPDGTRIAWIRGGALVQEDLVVSDLAGTDEVVLDSCNGGCSFGRIDWLAN